MRLFKFKKFIHLFTLLFVITLTRQSLALSPKELEPLKAKLLADDPTFVSIVNDCGALNEADFAEFNVTEVNTENELREGAKISYLSETTQKEGADSNKENQKTYAGNIKKKTSCKNQDHKFYGVRNLRSVLNGVAFRGGANNVYNSEFGVRENENPLPEIALKNLCIQGFSNAVYLYSKNFKGPYQVTCKTQKNESNTLHYLRLQPEKAFQAKANAEDLETLIKLNYEQIVSVENNQHPVYVHCYNGWHASGRAAALLLQQFCDADPATAISYWIENAHGSYQEAYKAIWKQILSFDQLKNKSPFNEYKIDSKLKEKVCPDLKNYKELAEKNDEIKSFLEKNHTTAE
jgi:hypothetical protein